ncbi:hypothetical protein C8R43DRAFT_957045 [Mycena crocata]|nr:hypothetical protein C8R43DRAFT_957045 [Mycena crocata]
MKKKKEESSPGNFKAVEDGGGRQRRMGQIFALVGFYHDSASCDLTRGSRRERKRESEAFKTERRDDVCVNLSACSPSPLSRARFRADDLYKRDGRGLVIERSERPFGTVADATVPLDTRKKGDGILADESLFTGESVGFRAKPAMLAILHSESRDFG